MLNLSEQIKNDIVKKFNNKLSPLLKNQGSCDLTFSLEKLIFHGKIHLNIPGESLYAEASDKEFYHTTILLLEKIKRQIEKKHHSK